MTRNQRIHLMSDLWPAAAAVLGCSADDRERRLAEISQALGRPVDSASDIKSNKDFDAVKGHLLAISQSANVNAQVAIANMPRTRLIVGIRQRAARLNYHLPALSLDRFHTEDWEGLQEWQLEQLRDTLAAREQAKHQTEAVAVAESDPDWRV